MRKIINISFIVCIICFIVLNFIKTNKDITILAKYGTTLTNSLSSFMDEHNVNIEVVYYNDEKEITNLLKNGKYDLIICPISIEKELIDNELIKELYKDKLLNIRNIKEEYLNEDNYYVPFFINNNSLNGIFTLNNNNSVTDVIEYLLRADVSADIIKNNNFENINWAAEYYL